LKGILYTFRTTPVAAIAAKVGILHTLVRLNYIYKKYSFKDIILLEPHLLRTKYPVTFPPYFLSVPRCEDFDSTTPWYQTLSRLKFLTRLDTILRKVNPKLDPISEIETFNLIIIPSCYQTKGQVEIEEIENENATECHYRLQEKIQKTNNYMVAYSDGLKQEKQFM
jgi:hypothetical protein